MIQKEKRQVGNRNPNVELLRIFGAFIVVTVHTNLSAYINGEVDYSRVLLKCFVSDGVGVFWLILGFFYFKNKDWLRLLNKTLKRIVIPTVALLVFWQLIGSRVLVEHTPILSSIQTGFQEIGNLWNAMVEMDTKYISHTGYIWYMFVYILLMLFFPLASGYKYLSEKEKNILLAVVLLVFAVNDLHANQLMKFSHHTINGLIPAIMICIVGERLYSGREMFRKWYWTVIGGGGMILVNIVRSIIQYDYYITADSNYFIYWYTTMGIMTVVFLAIFCFSLPLQKWEKIINYIASKTMGIYLIHIIVRDVLDGYKIQEGLYTYFDMDYAGLLKEFIFTFTYSGAVMLIAFVAVVLFDEGVKVIKNILRKGQEIRRI